MLKKLFTPKEHKTVTIKEAEHTQYKTVTVRKGIFHTVSFTSFNRK